MNKIKKHLPVLIGVVILINFSTTIFGMNNNEERLSSLDFSLQIKRLVNKFDSIGEAFADLDIEGDCSLAFIHNSRWPDVNYYKESIDEMSSKKLFKHIEFYISACQQAIVRIIKPNQEDYDYFNSQIRKSLYYLYNCCHCLQSKNCILALQIVEKFNFLLLNYKNFKKLGKTFLWKDPKFSIEQIGAMDGKNLFKYFTSYILECEQAITSIKSNKKNYDMFAYRIDESLAHLQVCITFLKKKLACYLDNSNFSNMYYFQCNVMTRYEVLYDTCITFKEACLQDSYD